MRGGLSPSDVLRDEEAVRQAGMLLAGPEGCSRVVRVWLPCAWGSRMEAGLWGAWGASWGALEGELTVMSTVTGPGDDTRTVSWLWWTVMLGEPGRPARSCTCATACHHLPVWARLRRMVMAAIKYLLTPPGCASKVGCSGRGA